METLMLVFNVSCENQDDLSVSVYMYALKSELILLLRARLIQPFSAILHATMMTTESVEILAFKKQIISDYP